MKLGEKLSLALSVPPRITGYNVLVRYYGDLDYGIPKGRFWVPVVSPRRLPASVQRLMATTGVSATLRRPAWEILRRLLEE